MSKIGKVGLGLAAFGIGFDLMNRRLARTARLRYQIQRAQQRYDVEHDMLRERIRSHLQAIHDSAAEAGTGSVRTRTELDRCVFQEEMERLQVIADRHPELVRTVCQEEGLYFELDVEPYLSAG